MEGKPGMAAVQGALRRATPNSRKTPSLRKLDGRSCVAVAIRRYRDALLTSLPAPISHIACELAERASVLHQHLTELDAAGLANGGLDPARAKMYLEMSAQHARILHRLGGMQAPAKTSPGAALDAYLAKYESGEGATA
jgi:hypothetical protein